MKNTLNKIYFHPIFLLTTLIFTLMGYFRLVIYFMLLIVVHELGHIIVSLIFKWNIYKIIILPFGGLIKYDDVINRPLIQEFLVAVAGITVQFLFYLLISTRVNYEYFSKINYFIIYFNLIPIYPLDGSKILNVFFNIITSFKNSILLTCIISYIFIVGLSILFFSANKLIIIIIMFLFIEVNRLYKNRNDLFNKFLLERYLRKLKFKKEKVVDNVYEMKKDYRHLFYVNGKYLTEKFFLTKMFDINDNL